MSLDSRLNETICTNIRVRLIAVTGSGRTLAQLQLECEVGRSRTDLLLLLPVHSPIFILLNKSNAIN